jgi:hypothetical protein
MADAIDNDMASLRGSRRKASSRIGFAGLGSMGAPLAGSLA